MGASPEKLAAEVERTREDLGETLDAIGAKVDDLREQARPANLARTKAAKIAGGALLGLLALRWLRGRRAKKKDRD